MEGLISKVDLRAKEKKWRSIETGSVLKADAERLEDEGKHAM